MAEYGTPTSNDKGIVPAQPVIQSASATTSPDNSNSGPMAYVVTAIVLAVLLLLAGSLGSCATSVLDAVGDDYWSGHGYTDAPGTSDPYGIEDRQNQRTDSGQTTEPETVSVTDALDLNLSVYEGPLSSYVSASDYAGTEQAVTDYVRSILSVDEQATTVVVQCLRAAARDEATRSHSIRAAIEAADAAQRDIAALEAPVATKGDTDLLATEMQAARDCAANRWAAISQELSLLDTTDELSYADLSDADAQARTASDDATTAITYVLIDSTAN